MAIFIVLWYFIDSIYYGLYMHGGLFKKAGRLMKKTAIIIAALAVSVSVLLGVASGSYEDEFQKAVEQYKEGSYEEAARILEQYVSERPEGRAYYLLGYANYAMGKHDEAARNFQDAYLVSPEMSPMDFRKAIGIDTGIPPRPKVRKPSPAVKEAAPTPTPAVKAPAEKAPAKAAPAPRPRPRPTPAPAKPSAPPMLDKAMEFITVLGLIPLIIGVAVYLFYCLSVFMIGRKTDTGASWLAFVPGINFVWPLVGAANKSKIWILLTLLIPLVSLYLWMLVAGRFGKSKVLGLLFGLIVGVPLLNLLFVKLVFKEAGAAGAGAAMGFELPEIPDEMPELPEVPGMEALGEEAPAEELFGEGFGEEEPKKEAPAEEPLEDDFAGLMEEAEKAPSEFGEEEAPTLEDMGFDEEAPAEEAFDFGEEEEEAAAPADVFEETAEDIFGEEEEESLEEIMPEEAAEKAAPHEGAEPWEIPEEEPLEYEAAEEEMEAGMLPPEAVGAGLIGIGELFSKTFGVFKKRVLHLIGLYFISILVTGVSAGIFVGIGVLLGGMFEGMQNGIFIGTGIVAAIAGIIAFGWGYGAFIHAVADESLGIGAALKRSWQRVGSFIWVFLLAQIIIVGGFGLFFIPGILFAVWFSFALFVFAKEGVSGMSALLKSKEYVKGHFGGIFLRFFLVVIISVGISWIPIAGSILSLLYAPFMMLFVYNLYADLRGLKGKLAFAPSGGQKALWLVLGLLGWIVAPIILFALAGMAVFAPLLMNMQSQF
jgi:hypothetical protein